MNDWLPPKPIDASGGKIASDSWKDHLITSKGKPQALLANGIVALRFAPELAGMLGFDESAHRTMLMRAPPWSTSVSYPRAWGEADDICFADWSQHHAIAISPLVAGQAVQAVALQRPFHPIRDYLDRLKWDGDRRLDAWLCTYLGATSGIAGDYIAAIGARWLIGAVARVMKPGCKNDCALILEGPQGARKSTALRVLAEPWFSDDMADIGSKDAQLQIRGTWIIEWSELDSMGRVEVSRIKAFMSRATDRFRPPYGHRLVELPRESVFAGTTNSDSYLRDEGGARRFWPCRCGDIDIKSLRRDRDQLWAEAVMRFRDGAVWWLDKRELEDAARVQQADRYESGVWDEAIRIWVKDRETTSIDEILLDCILMEKAKWTQAHKNHVARALISFGWERFKAGPRGEREWRYRRVSQSMSLGPQTGTPHHFDF